ncbi:MAG: dioxygenase [Verrucomicrobia bacterium]|nr:dioxygenase [Verrucomicrobiota bacterium]
MNNKSCNVSCAAPVRKLVRQHRARGAQYAVIDLGDVTRVVLMATPAGRGPVRAQAEEALRAIGAVLKRQRHPQTVTVQAVFLKNAKDQAVCERVFAEHFGDQLPVTTYVWQPPCDGSALAIEAWSVGGNAHIERPLRNVVTVTYKGITWTYCGGVSLERTKGRVHRESLNGFWQLETMLKKAGVGFDHVVRTWLYLGHITGPEGDLERYMELNRARTDFYRRIRFGHGHLMPRVERAVYPASTGIGMKGHGLVMSATAVDTARKDVMWAPLENPLQTPVYEYERVYSPKSPKFVRAMASVMGDYVTMWVSGTASIVNSKTQHVGDPRLQTEQTIDNIEQLISRENLASHGLRGAGAAVSDLARVRVYVKRPQDYRVCREVCARRFKKVPIVYTVADVCRSDLLVEMEGVAFVRRSFAR